MQWQTTPSSFWFQFIVCEDPDFRYGEDGIWTSYSPEVQVFLKEEDRNGGLAWNIEIFLPQKTTSDELKQNLRIWDDHLQYCCYWWVYTYVGQIMVRGRRFNLRYIGANRHLYRRNWAEPKTRSATPWQAMVLKYNNLYYLPKNPKSSDGPVPWRSLATKIDTGPGNTPEWPSICQARKHKLTTCHVTSTKSMLLNVHRVTFLKTNSNFEGCGKITTLSTVFKGCIWISRFSILLFSFNYPHIESTSSYWELCANVKRAFVSWSCTLSRC